MSILKSTQSGKHRKLTLQYLTKELHWQQDIIGVMGGKPVGKVGPALFLRADSAGMFVNNEEYLDFKGDEFLFQTYVEGTRTKMIFNVETIHDVDLIIEYFNATHKKHIQEILYKMSVHMKFRVENSEPQTEMNFDEPKVSFPGVFGML